VKNYRFSCVFAFVLLTSSLLVSAAPNSGAHMPAPDRSHWPAALRNVPLERLSTGALMLLDQGGDLVQPPPITSSETQAAATTGVVLDLRVAPNLRLGNDPGGLPPNMRAQAEPHIARSQVDPDFLVATFQEGRFTDGGAVDCGYSVTQDGGLSWTRTLIPGLTTASGGPYPRATDPVVGIDLDDGVFLCTEAATDAAFTQGVILVSHSLDRGVTVDPPSIVFQPTVSGDFPDKPWMVVNTFDGTAHAGRVLVTWTEFGTTDASPILRSYSDDHGVSWSTAAPIHSSTSMAQGSQPVFLSSGQAAIVYWNFGESGFGGDEGAVAPGPEEIDVVLSGNGGQTFGAPRMVTTVSRYEPPSIRSGVFLPSAASDRTTNSLYVVYQGLDVLGSPRIFFTKSSNAGVTWSAPIAVSDNPGTGVFNAAISAAPGGGHLTVVFYDQRDNTPGNTTQCNLYLAQSFDGGLTWQPNIRLTSITTNAALAPLTPDGYILGDYQGIAESTTPDVPAVPVWIDTRKGQPDPFITRVGIASEVNFTAFQASRLSLAQINDPLLGGKTGDADGDNEDNLSEFLSQTEPNDPASVIHTSRQLNISTRETVGTGDNVLIGGFIVTGTTPKSVLLRAIGPSLADQGLSGVLQDPVLELHQGNSLIVQNDNWKSTQKTAIEDTGIPPTDDRESAIVITLAPGEYTAIVRGKNAAIGTALVEAYDLDPTPASQFGNISTRGEVGTGTNVLIGGLIVSPEADAQANVVLRALGPSLGGMGVSGPLQDPTLELHDKEGAIIASNDNWRETQEGIISSTDLGPTDDREAALFATLPAGEYTAVVQGAGGTSGVGLVEAFNIP
jgi:hypothetical protein